MPHTPGMSSINPSFNHAIKHFDFSTINQCIERVILNKQGHALAKEIAAQSSYAMYVSRLLPILQSSDQEKFAEAGLNRVLTQLSQRLVPIAVHATLRMGPGLFVIAGFRPSNSKVEIMVQTFEGRWIHRELKQQPSKFPQGRHVEGLMGFNYGFIGVFQVEDDDAIQKIWVNGFPVDVVMQNLEESAFLDQVDDLLHLCRHVHVPLNKLPEILDDGLFALVCRLRDPLRNSTAWTKFVSQDEMIGSPVVEPKITVVIPLFRSWMLFIQGHFAAFSLDPSFCSGNIEILYVVDDPEIEMDVIEWIRNHGSYMPFSIRIVSLRRNMGFGMACNIGVHVARSDFVVLMNSDVFPDSSGWVDKLLSRLHGNAGSLVAPFLTYETGNVQHCGMYPAFSGVKNALIPCNYHHFKGLDSDKVRLNLDQEGVNESPVLSGAVLSFRREDFLDLGGFDPLFGCGDFEDLELSLRWKRLCGPLLIDSLVSLHHLERQSMNVADSDLKTWRGRFNALCAIRLFPEMVHC